jgi:hypothetical protein
VGGEEGGEVRVFSKQTNKIFGSNRNKQKLNLLRLIFGLFQETKNFGFGLILFVSVVSTRVETTKRTETKRSFLKQTKKIEKEK